MGYAAKIIADSMSPDGFRLTSFEVTFPRIVLAEFNTHRVLSRNSASSRAIPVEKMLERVRNDSFVPVYWGKNQKGMVADQELTDDEQMQARMAWAAARELSITQVQKLLEVGVHKQITNRLLEPWMFHTVIVTATEWMNFFNLRRDKDAQPEIRKAAEMMWACMNESQPRDLHYGQWHLPLVTGIDHEQLLDEGYKELDLAYISCGRCARVTHLTHEGKRDPKADIALALERLAPSGHMSPLEHAARPMSDNELELFKRPGIRVVNIDGKLELTADWLRPTYYCGNVQGWVQMRKLTPNEAVFHNPRLA
jgi:Thymidylate synthase complementing protein